MSRTFINPRGEAKDALNSDESAGSRSCLFSDSAGADPCASFAPCELTGHCRLQPSKCALQGLRHQGRSYELIYHAEFGYDVWLSTAADPAGVDVILYFASSVVQKPSGKLAALSRR